jgi:hypothetical protein
MLSLSISSQRGNNGKRSWVVDMNAKLSMELDGRRVTRKSMMGRLNHARRGLFCAFQSSALSHIKGLSPLYTLQLAAKFRFQPRTSKPDNFGPPTLEKVQISSFWAVFACEQ